jgi:hypothetical protein
VFFLPSSFFPFSSIVPTYFYLALCFYIGCLPFNFVPFMQIDKPLQNHGGRLEHNEEYCGSCFGAEMVC